MGSVDGGVGPSKPGGGQGEAEMAAEKKVSPVGVGVGGAGPQGKVDEYLRQQHTHLCVRVRALHGFTTLDGPRKHGTPSLDGGGRAA